MIAIRFQLFGALRKYESSVNPLVVHVQTPQAVPAIKDILKHELSGRFSNLFDESLLAASVIADQDRVLNGNELVTSSCELLVLPPVCGG